MNNDNTIMTDNEDIECVNLLKNSSDEKYCKYLSEKIGKEFKTCSELCLPKSCFDSTTRKNIIIRDWVYPVTRFTYQASKTN